MFAFMSVYTVTPANSICIFMYMILRFSCKKQLQPMLAIYQPFALINTMLNKVPPTFLLSSSTVFMFSIHTASTGPSNIIHFLWCVVLDACSLNVLAKIPERSNQSTMFTALMNKVKIPERSIQSTMFTALMNKVSRK